MFSLFRCCFDKLDVPYRCTMCTELASEHLDIRKTTKRDDATSSPTCKWVNFHLFNGDSYIIKKTALVGTDFLF